MKLFGNSRTQASKRFVPGSNSFSHEARTSPEKPAREKNPKANNERENFDDFVI
ncbi:hypothetical protein [Microbulbifer variabilis]|uniref:Uncharacterized protein n=1 Tax=Microbulbifer variabilis TaxID=266805 RepID=A0ABY4V9T1_9GAMM|nr:hypothetical protein [Microbulbifer variabilis]USD21028.1 hypothetical protein MJO52_18490 [Microbulbifer variabilis]